MAQKVVDWENSYFFNGVALSNEPVEEIRALVREQVFKANEEIFDEGDDATNVYILKSGQVELTFTLPTHRDQTVRITVVRPGELFAWSGLTGGTQLTARACAIEDSEAFIIPASGLRKVMDSHPDFGYRAMDRLASLIATRLSLTRTQLQWLTSSV